MELVIGILTTIGIVILFIAGTLIEKDGFLVFSLSVIGSVSIISAIITMGDYMEETSIRKYVNNEVTYDTISMNKNGELLEIKVIKNE